MKKNITTIFSSLLLASTLLISCPVLVFAQPTNNSQSQIQVSPSGTVTGPGTGTQQNSNGTETTQASTYRQGIEAGQGTAQSGSVADAAGNAIGCSAGQILSNILTSAISSAISGVTDSAVSTVANTSVPTNETGKVKENSNLATKASVGFSTFGVLLGTSWDSIAWCIINAIISYIADATIAWANSGFNGNPAFVDNPEKFFSDLADQEAGKFIQDLVKGTTGVNVCQPFKVQIAINLAKSYSSKGQRQSCSIDQIVKNYDSFVNSNFKEGGWNGWLSLTQNEQNNKYGAYLVNNDLLYGQIALKNNTAQVELGWNKGFLSFNRCEDKNDPKSCKTTTPGTLIQSSLEKTLNIPKDRLVIAQKFDQVVTVLINQLIKVALDKALESSKDSGSEDN